MLNSLVINVPSPPQACLHTLNRALILLLGLRNPLYQDPGSSSAQQTWGATKPPPPGTAAAGQAPKPQGVAVFSAVAAYFCPYCMASSCPSSGVNNGEGERERMARVVLLICWPRQLPSYQKQALLIFRGQSVLT